MSPSEKNGIILTKPNKEICFVAVLDYNKHHAALVMAFRREFVDGLEEEFGKKK